MSVVYKTYCRKAPKYRSRKKFICSCFTKPKGGLWGCRGDEWIEWCREEKFALKKWKECFEWTLKKDAKILTIRSASGFAKLIKKYYREVAPFVGEIDYLQIAKEYDAIELTEVPVNELRFGFKSEQIPVDDFMYDMGKRTLYQVGTYGWDVPSICVFNTDKVEVIRSYKVS